MTSDMSPALTGNNSLNRFDANSKSSSDGWSAIPDNPTPVCGSDARHFGRRQFAGPVLIPLVGDVLPPSFGHHIRSIVGLSSLEQMTGVTAGTIVASVQNTKRVDDCSVSDEEGHPVGSLLSAIKIELTVSTHTVTKPGPAFIFIPDIDMRPESLSCVFWLAHFANHNGIILSDQE